MKPFDQDLFPLAKVGQSDLASLCESLWGWSPCQHWIDRNSPHIEGCDCHRAIALKPFFDFYKESTTCYLPDVVGHSSQALSSHPDLSAIISTLVHSNEECRTELMMEYFAHREQQGHEKPPLIDQNRAFSLAARMISMVQSSAESQPVPDGLLESGIQPVTWHSDQSFPIFLASVFPKKELRAPDNAGDRGRNRSDNYLYQLTAKRLRKVAHLELIPTNDLRNHLYLDEAKGTVSIFHYTSFLKESLAASSAGGQSKDRSGLPSDLVIETLATLKEVLFPDDQKSQSVLRALVTKKGFDPDILRVVKSSIYRSAVEQPIYYRYWGSRLEDLRDELENPTPRGFVAQWLERKSGSRYVMMATLAGVLIAVLLGVCSLAVSLFQAWVGWQQWQHPVSGG